MDTKTEMREPSRSLAARAPRRLTMHDGRLIGDEKNGKKAKPVKKRS